MLKKILIGLLIVLVIAQFIQPSKNNGIASPATDISHALAVPDTIMGILKTSCYDCHSNHTEYPWYSRITPVNWWLKNHIDDGKHELNFSEFSTYNAKRKNKKLEELAEQIEKKEMPLKSYALIHTNSRLNDDQRKQLIDWAKAEREKISPGSTTTEAEGSEEKKD